MKFRSIFFIAVMMAFNCLPAYAVDIKDVTIKIPHFGKVVFNHNKHFKQAGIKNNCKACHNAIFNLRVKKRHTMAAMIKGKSCGACHDGKRAFATLECIKCHSVNDVVFQVKDTGDVTFSHKLHTSIYACGDCHDKRYKPAAKGKKITMADMEKAKSCGGCHDDKSAFTVKGNCDRCHKM